MSEAVDRMLEDYRRRWQADYVARALWKLAHGRMSWQGVSTSSSYTDRGTSLRDRWEGRSQDLGAVAYYLPIRVDEREELDIPEHRLELWRQDFLAARAALRQDETDELESYLLKPRLSAVFAWHKKSATIQRSDNASEALANAVLRIRDVAVRVDYSEVTG